MNQLVGNTIDETSLLSIFFLMSFIGSVMSLLIVALQLKKQDEEYFMEQNALRMKLAYSTISIEEYQRQHRVSMG